MAVKIERGGWALIFLVGLGLVGYSLQKYGVVDFRGWLGSKADSASSEPVDTSKPLPVAATPDSSCNTARVRVNIWVGCAAGLVANGGLDTASGSIYDKAGLKVSFKIIDDWTEGAAALATDNVDVMLTRRMSGRKTTPSFRTRKSGRTPSLWWIGRAAPMA